jgi:hypothetical protein
LMQKRAPEFGRDPELAHSRSTVSKYLRGQSKPDEDWLELFALTFDLTGVQMLDLFARADR